MRVFPPTTYNPSWGGAPRGGGLYEGYFIFYLIDGNAWYYGTGINIGFSQLTDEGNRFSAFDKTMGTWGGRYFNATLRPQITTKTNIEPT